MSSIKVGSVVPLEVQVACQSDEIVFIKAEIRDKNANIIGIREMINGGNGRFYNYSYTMPNIDFISVQYLPFDDAAYSIPSADFCADTEIFNKLEEVAAGEGISALTIIGKILNTPLSGKIRPNAITLGKIRIFGLRGVIKQNVKVLGKINSSTLKGVLLCRN